MELRHGVVTDRGNGVKRRGFFLFKIREVRAYLYAEGNDLIKGDIDGIGQREFLEMGAWTGKRKVDIVSSEVGGLVLGISPRKKADRYIGTSASSWVDVPRGVCRSSLSCDWFNFLSKIRRSHRAESEDREGDVRIGRKVGKQMTIELQYGCPVAVSTHSRFVIVSLSDTSQCGHVLFSSHVQRLGVNKE